MASSAAYNGQIPTDPHIVLLVGLALVGAAGQLSHEQAQALIATGGIAEIVLLAFRLSRGRR